MDKISSGRHKNCYELSYLTDLPVEWLKEAIHGLEKNSPFTVTGFLEPGDMICTVGWHNCYYFSEFSPAKESSLTVRQQPISMVEFCKMLYTDIANHLDEWVKWDDDGLQSMAGEFNEDDEWVVDQDYYLQLYQERKDEIQQLLDRLAELIRMREKTFKH